MAIISNPVPNIDFMASSVEWEYVLVKHSNSHTTVPTSLIIRLKATTQKTKRRIVKTRYDRNVQHELYFVWLEGGLALNQQRYISPRS